MNRWRLVLPSTALALAVSSATVSTLPVETLRSVASLPPHIVGAFEDPVNFQQGPSGLYYVFDRRAHAVYTIDPEKKTSRKAVDIGQEQGRILQPYGFDVGPDGTFVVADVPRAQERVQTFDAIGERLSGFLLPGKPSVLVTFGNVALNGLASIEHLGGTMLMSYPETGALFTEFSTRGGYPQRSIGTLRATGFESDRDVHLAMNAGLPLVNPAGGFYYVFLTGRPMFRKYDANGALVFERHIEGVELDAFVAAQPNQWPRRRLEDREIPIVPPVVRTAAVDRQGRLWISFAVPYTYVYDAQGDKVRTVQFNGAGIMSPTSMSFAPSGRLLVTPGCYEFDPR